MPQTIPESHADGAGAPPIGATRAADFALSDTRGAVFRLSDYLGGGPVVVVFYRGHWCPYCRRYLGKLRDVWPRLREKGATLVAISPEPPGTSRALAEQLALPFPLLSDPGGKVIDAFGTRNGLGAVRTVLPHPSVFVLDGCGKIRFRSIDRNYKKRTTMRAILAAVDEPSAP